MENEQAYMAMNVEERIAYLQKLEDERYAKHLANQNVIFDAKAASKPNNEVKPSVISEAKSYAENFVKIDTKELNNRSIKHYLEMQGVKRIPPTNNEKYGMYHAIWRGDKNASLKVDYQNNTWYDFGTGEHGGAIDIVKKLHNVEFKEACNILSNGLIPTLSYSVEKTFVQKEKNIEITGEKPISSFALRDYYEKRGIDKATAMQYLKEINYTINEKKYFGLGFKNDSGDYEIRNAYFKGCSGKDISTFQKDTTRCAVFEGFFDFLAYETLSRKFPQEYPKTDAVVLNSVVNAEKETFKNFISKYPRVDCFLDNDNAGKKVLVVLQQNFGEKIVDNSSRYSNNKDFNEFLTAQFPQISQQRKI